MMSFMYVGTIVYHKFRLYSGLSLFTLSGYKTKRHFRLSEEGGLKIYRNEKEKNYSPIEEVELDFMR